MKNTKNKTYILKKLNGCKLNAKEIHEGSDMNLTTVYRILEKLEKEEILKSTIGKNQTLHYEIYHKHNHLLVCNVCNDEQVLEKCFFSQAEEDIYTLTGFKIDDEKIYGVCNKCNK